MNPRPALGKGLASLLPAAGTPAATPAQPPKMGTGAELAGPVISATPTTISNAERIPGIGYAPVDDIVVNPYQPRREFDDTALKELSDSIKTNGIIQPIVVRKGPYGYQLIAGERRLRAAKLAGLKQVPIVIRKSTDREALELALVENIQRQDLNPIDEALAYLQLMEDFNLTQDEVAVRVGKERSTVANHIRLLRLPEAVISDLKSGVLSFGHGKVILSLEENDNRLLLRKKIIEDKLSVRAAEEWVSQFKAEKPPVQSGSQQPEFKPLTTVQQRFRNMGLDLTRSIGLRVEIKGNEQKGKVVLSFSKREELDRVLQLLQNQ